MSPSVFRGFTVIGFLIQALFALLSVVVLFFYPILDTKLADILKPSNVLADRKMDGEGDFVAEAATEGYSRITFMPIKETKSKTQGSRGIETNLDMLPLS